MNRDWLNCHVMDKRKFFFHSGLKGNAILLVLEGDYFHWYSGLEK